MRFSIADRIKKFGKLALSNPGFINIILPKLDDKSKAVLIGTPVHCNIGDHLIAEQGLKYLEGFEFEKVVEITEFAYELFPSIIKITHNDVIFINGGGWMGEDYEDEEVIEDIVSRYPHNYIIILPQTIHISDNNIKCINRMSRILNSSNRLIITLREKNSYDICCNLLQIPTERLFLLPDMGLLHNFEKNNCTNHLALFSMRDDVERIDNSLIDELRCLLIEQGYSINNTSTVVNRPLKNIPVKKRSLFLNNKIKEFADARLIVTDRLHSMILAIISGTKCIAFDNTTHKVKGVAELWLRDCPSLLFYDKTMLDLNLIQSFIESERCSYLHDYTEDFNPLSVYIRSIINDIA